MQQDTSNPLILWSPYPLWSILGFNLGIEMGQCLVAIMLWVVIGALRRLLPRQLEATWQRLAAIVALLAGTFWLLERLMGAV